MTEQINVPRVQPLSFVKVGLALVPLTAPSAHVGKRLRHTTAIGQEFTGLLEVTNGGVVILQAGVMVMADRMHRFTQIGLKFERGLRCFSRFFAKGDRWLQVECQVVL